MRILKYAIFLLLFGIAENVLAQKLTIKFKYPLHLSEGSLDYFVGIEYYNHTTLNVVKKPILLKDQQTIVYDFDQSFPVEAIVKIEFRGVNEKLYFYLEPASELTVKINQQVKLTRFDRDRIPHKYYEEKYRLAGDGVELNTLFLKYSRYLQQEPSMSFYDLYANFKTKTPEECRAALNQKLVREFTTKHQQIEDLPLPTIKEAVFFRRYLKYIHLAELGSDAMHHIKYNGYHYKMDSVAFYKFTSQFVKSNTGNLRLRKMYWLIEQLPLYNDKSFSATRYASSVPFNAYLAGEDAVISAIWEEEFKDSLKRKKGVENPLSIAFEIYRNSRWEDAEKNGTILNDLYFNGKMYNKYYSDSVFLETLKKSAYADGVKILKAENRIRSIDDFSPLSDVNSYRPDLPMRRMYYSTAHVNLFKAFFKKYDKKNWDTYLGKMLKHNQEVADNPYEHHNTQVTYLATDASVYKELTSHPNKLVYAVLFDESYYNGAMSKITVLEELSKRYTNEQLELIVLIDWGRAERESVVENTLEYLRSAELLHRVSPFIVSHISGLNFYNETNLKTPWDMLVVDKEGELAICKPKGSGYFSYKEYERRMLNYSYALNSIRASGSSRREPSYSTDSYDMEGVLIDEVMEEYDVEVPIFDMDRPTRAEEPKKVDETPLYTIEPYRKPEYSIPGFFSIMDQLVIKTRTKEEVLKQRDSVLDLYFNQGKGWYAIESDNGTMMLSKNSFQSVKSKVPVRWIKKPNSNQLFVFGQTSLNDSTASVKYNSEAMTLTSTINGIDSVYKILFHDREFIVLYPLEKWKEE
jgi:hypothetical protein